MRVDCRILTSILAIQNTLKLTNCVSGSVSVLQQPPPHVQDLMAAAATHQPLADRIASNYGRPRRAWDDPCSPERTTALMRRYISDL